MTGTQIKTQAEALIDDIIADANVILWINECQSEDLGHDARKLGSASIAVADTSLWYDLPTDFLVVEEIVDSDDEEYTGEYKIRGTKIKFDTAGTWTLWYWGLPDAVTALTETPQAHTLMHYPIAIFVAAQHRALEADADPEELNDHVRLMSLYERAKEKALYMIDNPEQDGSFSIRVV